MAMTNLSRWYWLKRREYRYSLINPGIPAPVVPKLSPSPSWNGTAGSGGTAPVKTGMTVSLQEWYTHMGVQAVDGITGGIPSPAAHFVFTRKFIPDGGFTGDLDIAVAAEDWGDEAEVTFWVEGNTITVTPETRSLVSIPVHGGTTLAILPAINIPATVADGAINVYATVTSPRAGFSPRVIGPVRVHKSASGPHRIIRLGTSEPTVTGVSYSDLAQALRYAEANTTDPWIKIQLFSDFTHDTSTSWGTNPSLSNSRRGIIDIDPGVFNFNLMASVKSDFRPRVNGLVIRKAKINMQNIGQLYSEQGISTTASTANFRPYYFIDSELYSVGNTEIYNNQTARSVPTIKYGIGQIACHIRDIVHGDAISVYRVGNLHERVAGDLMHWIGFAGSTSEGGPSFCGWNSAKDCTSELIRLGVPGWHYTYSGAGTPTVEISGLNNRTSRTVTAKINGVAQTPTFAASVTVGSGLYLVSDFVAAANAALGSLGFNFVTDNDAIRFAHSGSESSTDIITPGQAVNMSVWIHGDWMQTGSTQHDNSLFINNRAWNCEFQQFPSLQGATKAGYNCYWINNVCLLANTDTDLQWQIYGNYRASSWKHNSHPNQNFSLRWGGGTSSSFDADCRFSNNILRNMLEYEYGSRLRPVIENNHSYVGGTIPTATGTTTGGTSIADFPAITSFTYTDNDFAPSSGAMVRNFPAVPTVKYDINAKERPALALLGGTIDLSLNSITAILSLPENAIAGDIAGALSGTTTGSVLALVSNADNRIALSGTNIVKGSGAIDFESNTTHTFTISETNPAMSNSPKYSELTLNITNVLEVSLGALSGTFTLDENATAGTVAGTISNKTPGSTITLIDDAGGRVNLSGNNILKGSADLDYETNTTHTFVVRETHPDGSNSPRDTTLTLNISDIAEPVTSPISAISANGWQTTMVNPTELAFYEVPIIDTGFNSSGAVVPVIENRYTTKRVRQPYPNQASLTTADAALNDYIYSTATIDGIVNSSAVASPKPIASWVTPDRSVIGSTLTVDIVAFHRDGRNGKPVAAITGTATDGTTTVTATTATPIVLGHPGDQNAVIGYRLVFSTGGLADQSLVTVNAKVYPHIGGTSSILDSSAGTAGNRGFVPLVFYKHNAKSSTPPYVYVNATSGIDATVDTNGVSGGLTKVSTTAATAAANPFLTLVSAFNALRAATAITGGFSTGCIVRIVGTVAEDAGAFTSATYQNGGELIIEGVSGSTPVLTFGAASNRNTYNPYVKLRNMGITRNGANAMGSGISQLVLENVTFDGGSQGTAFTGTNCHAWIMGMVLTNPGSNLNFGTNQQLRLARGISAVAAFNIENWITLGCYIQASWTPTIVTARPPHGGIFAFNRVYKVAGSSVTLSLGSVDIDGYAAVQNVWEKIDTFSQTSLRVSGDGDTSNITHLISWNNTLIGFGLYGRSNILYDEHASVARNHKLQSFRGNIHTQLNHKSDIFIQNGSRTGAWGYGNGVGCVGEFSQFVDAGPNQLSFRQDYPGLKANIGQSQTVRNDPLFTSYAATTNTGTTAVAGAGGGTYTVQAGSPAIGVLTTAEEVLPFDLAGGARDRGTVGAYR